MSYDYVRRMYGVDPVPGQRVRHLETKEWGTVLPERASHAHYVQVEFDNSGAGLSHPKALRYEN